MPVTKCKRGYGLATPTSARPHKHKHGFLALMSHTYPERLVQRGWRELAGVRSTWPPPPLTAPCRGSQSSSVLSLFSHGAAPSTAPLFPRVLNNKSASFPARDTTDGCTLGLIILMHGPYGAVGLELPSSLWALATARVLQSHSSPRRLLTSYRDGWASAAPPPVTGELPVTSRPEPKSSLNLLLNWVMQTVGEVAGRCGVQKKNVTGRKTDEWEAWGALRGDGTYELDSSRIQN
ncbi:unnamed protein product [Pleuronectes platessa]|uniref:Uncharacterized protein n=1 Tax=Pleuronectes platessa TaxID=8262 RepID=A0A9N7UHE1_PLEPL|nr:unnamed protein product [Pleuronectes platessa]